MRRRIGRSCPAASFGDNGRSRLDHPERDAAGMLTLRQIEVVRAVMVTGTIARRAKLPNGSAPGISRLMKYTETSLGIRLFERRHGRFVPAAQAKGIFEQVN